MYKNIHLQYLTKSWCSCTSIRVCQGQLFSFYFLGSFHYFTVLSRFGVFGLFSTGLFDPEPCIWEGLKRFGSLLNYSFLFVICSNSSSLLPLSFDSDLLCPVSCVSSCFYSSAFVHFPFFELSAKFAWSFIWGLFWPTPTWSWTRLIRAVWPALLAFLAPSHRSLSGSVYSERYSCFVSSVEPRASSRPGRLFSMQMWLANVTRQRGCDSDCSPPLESHWRRNPKKIKL